MSYKQVIEEQLTNRLKELKEEESEVRVLLDRIKGSNNIVFSNSQPIVRVKVKDNKKSKYSSYRKGSLEQITSILNKSPKPMTAMEVTNELALIFDVKGKAKRTMESSVSSILCQYSRPGRLFERAKGDDNKYIYVVKK